jgi:hypothetical protein
MSEINFTTDKIKICEFVNQYETMRARAEKAEEKLEILKELLSESTEMLGKATNCFKVFGLLSPHYYPYTKQIEKNKEILEKAGGEYE